MVAPLVAGAAIQGITSLIGGFLGAKADKRANKRAKEQYKLDKAASDRQIEISKYIEQYAKQAAGLSSDSTDIYGSKTWLNPATGKYEIVMGDTPRAIQGASDQEEQKRYSVDQAIRARGLQDFENMRGRSVTEADRSLDRIHNFDRGIGRLDAGQLGSQIRNDRTRAVNSGYDDAERAATKLQLRTGSSAVGDALTALARDRVRAQAQIGSPEVEALQMAEGINQGRSNDNFARYQGFGNEGRAFYDAAYSPSTREAELFARLGDAQKFDLSKLDLASGGSASAASTIGNAAAGLRAGYLASEANRVRAPWGQFIAAAGQQVGGMLPGGTPKFGKG